MAFSLATWNVLADAYIKKSYYPHTPDACLDPSWRRPALVARAEQLDADVLCLQEVERPFLDALAARLAPAGYSFEHAPKAGRRPDGCATFMRKSKAALHAAERLVYDDGSGHVALITKLAIEGALVGVVNTHLRWHPDDAAPAERFGVRQAVALAARLRSDTTCRTWIVCGDLNATPSSEVVKTLLAAGLHDPSAEDACTCNSNGRRKRIDFVLVTPDLGATAAALPGLSDDTPLPSAQHPSDHLPVTVSLRLEKVIPGR